MEIVELGPAEVHAHLEQLAQLLLDAHASNVALGLPPGLTFEDAAAAWARTADELAPGRRVLLAARVDGLIAGSAQIARAAAENGAHRAEVRRLAVRGDLRGHGIGRELLEATVDVARKLDVRLLWLTTHADSGSDRFYERCGWTRMGVMPAYAVRPDGTLAANVFYYREL